MVLKSTNYRNIAKNFQELIVPILVLKCNMIEISHLLIKLINRTHFGIEIFEKPYIDCIFSSINRTHFGIEILITLIMKNIFLLINRTHFGIEISQGTE